MPDAPFHARRLIQNLALGWKRQLAACDFAGFGKNSETGSTPL